jgi:hypothetical protein
MFFLGTALIRHRLWVFTRLLHKFVGLDVMRRGRMVQIFERAV